jgi:PEP-CTERM motif
MKKLIIVFAVAFLASQTIRAQGLMTYLSNVGQPSAGSLAVGNDSWLAAIFFTGNNTGGYTLNSIQLGMTDASGTPSGFTAMLYAINPINGIPGNSLGTLNGSFSPVTDGIYTYTAPSNLTLFPNAYYFIVLTAGTPVANGAYHWSLAGANSYNPSGGWNSVGGDLLTSVDGSSWSGLISDHPQYAINATAVPEPSAISLILLGSGVLFYVRRNFPR